MSKECSTFIESVFEKHGAAIRDIFNRNQKNNETLEDEEIIRIMARVGRPQIAFVSTFGGKTLLLEQFEKLKETVDAEQNSVVA